MNQFIFLLSSGMLATTFKIFNNIAYSKLILIRHGESECNRIKKWSGWSDAKLTPKGQIDAAQCAHLLTQEGLEFDIAYCSYLSRTIKTLNIILDTIDRLYLPVKKRWQLNQKFYGALQELDKMTIVRKYGKDIVSQWRRSYKIAPPVVFPQDPRHPINDKKYKNINPNLLPNSEHLGHVLDRVRGLYKTQIQNQLSEGKNILVICHGSVARAFTNILLDFNEKQSSKFNLPNTTPLVFEMNKKLQVEKWKLLGDQGNIQEKMKSIENQLNN